MMRTKNRLAHVAIGAAAVLSPLAFAPLSEAGGRRCGGTNPEYCFSVTTYASADSAKVEYVDVYLTNTSRDYRNVYATFYMFDGNGKIVRRFAEKKFDILERAYRTPPVVGQLTPRSRSYCAGAVSLRLPLAPWIAPCAYWSPGYRLGMFIYADGVGNAVYLDSSAETLAIK